MSDNVLFDPWDKWYACGAPVGGEWVPIDKLQLLVPLIGWASLAAAMAICFVGVQPIRKR